jgi:nucleoside-triphosphatase THEP1
MNILLTGEVNTGKSRLIDAFLSEYTGSIGGFKTLRRKTVLDDFFGIYLLDVCHIDEPLAMKNRIGTCYRDRSPVCHNEALEKSGVEALCFYSLPSLIVMDEIGVLEKDCTAFTNKIFECFDSSANVLGVIKKKSDSFLDSIISRSDVTVIEVRKDSHAQQLHMLKRYLSV